MKNQVLKNFKSLKDFSLTDKTAEEINEWEDINRKMKIRKTDEEKYQLWLWQITAFDQLQDVLG